MFNVINQLKRTASKTTDIADDRLLMGYGKLVMKPRVLCAVGLENVGNSVLSRTSLLSYESYLSKRICHPISRNDLSESTILPCYMHI